MAGILFIISAPSGSGKSTLVNQLRSLVTDLDFSVSYTTRAPRGSEQQDREYHYIRPAEFERWWTEGEFLEWAEVFGNYYGTACRSLTDAQAAGKDLLLDIDVQGAAQVREEMPDAVSIFLLPPTPDILGTRLRERSRKEGLWRRKKSPAGWPRPEEIENYRQYRYILVNDILDDAVEAVESDSDHGARRGATARDPETARMMQLAEKCRQANSTHRLWPVLSSFGLLDITATRA